MKRTKTIILAAGKGTRMRSDSPKVLHRICGRSLLDHVIAANKAAGMTDIAVIVGYQAERVRRTLPDDISVFVQSEQLGTGHAVMQALPFFEDFDGSVLILVGDAPLVRPETLTNLVEAHEAGGFAATVLTAHFSDPTGYGRIVKCGDELIKIVEQKDATEEERKITEINSGMYCFDARSLAGALKQIEPKNAQGEYYLTDTIEILRNAGKKVGSYPTTDPEDIEAVNSQVQLAAAAAVMRRRINTAMMERGVVMIDPGAIYLSAETTIEPNTVIYPGVVTKGRVSIGAHCVIGSGCVLENAAVGDGVEMEMAVVRNTEIAAGEKIEPFSKCIGKDKKT